MAYLSNDTFNIDIALIPTIHIPVEKTIIRSKLGRVYLSIGSKVVELSTITAHKIGMAIFNAKIDYNELIVLEINKERFEYLWPNAKKVAAGLLRKADDADDWQLNRRKK